MLLPDRDLFAVADGMGGHQGGEVASRLAIETLQVAYQDPTAEALVEAIAVANHRIRNEGDADPDLRGHGHHRRRRWRSCPRSPTRTTPTTTPTRPQHLVIANVGDCRGYLLRDGELVQLTEDHSLVADLVREGRITAEEAEVHPQRNIVTRVLGITRRVEVDLWPVDPVARRPLPAVLRRPVQRGRRRPDRQRAAPPRRPRRGGRRARAAGQRGRRPRQHHRRRGRRRRRRRRRRARPRRPWRATRPASSRRARARAGVDDPAGFTTALPAVDAADADAGRGRAGAAPPSRRARSAAPRRPAHPVHLARRCCSCCSCSAVIGGAVATIQWYGTSTYFVGFDGDEVVIFQGRPGGLLWFEPELRGAHRHRPRRRAPSATSPRIDAGNEQPTLGRGPAARRQHRGATSTSADRRPRPPPRRPRRTTSTTAATTTTQAN